VVFADNPLKNLDFERLTGLADQFSRLERNIAFQNVIAIFRHKNKVVLNFENSMATVTIVHLSYQPLQKASKINLTA
jgi:hypothetical protein